MSEKISRRNFLRTATLGAAAAGLLAGCGNSAASGSTAASTAAGTYTAGTYSATATGINTTTPVTVTMTFSADAITDVQIDVANETKGYGADIADEMVKKILEAQSSEVDGHSGATITSGAIKKAAESCINQAKGVAVAPTEASKAETVVPDGLTTEEVESSVVELGDITPDETKDFDVVVVGAGAAGVPAAGWAAELGGHVALLQKQNIVVSQGNCGSAIIKSKSTEAGKKMWVHMTNGLCDWRADTSLLNAYVENSEEALMWYLNRAGLTDQTEYGDGSLVDSNKDPSSLLHNDEKEIFAYMCTSQDLTGVWKDRMDTYDFGDEHCYFFAPWIGPKPKNVGDVLATVLENVQAKNSNLETFFNTPAVKLVHADGKVTGVIAKDESGKYIQFNASKGVILATGDYMNNEAMVKRWCPDVDGYDKKQYQKTGDGHIMAIDAGAKMENLGHTKMMHDFDSGLMYEEPFLYVNMEGKRFCNEDTGFVYMGNITKYLPRYNGANVDANHPDGSLGWYCQIYDSDYMSYANSPVPEQVMTKYIPGAVENPQGVFTNLIDTYKADTIEELADKLAYNMDTCKRILEGAGVLDHDNDGRLEYMSGSIQEIELSFLVCSDSSAKTGMCQKFAEDMATIGLKIDVQELTWDDYMTALEEGNFDMYYGEIKLRNNFDLTELLDPDNKYDEKKNPNGINFTGITDPNYVMYLNDYLAAGDVERDYKYNQFCSYLTENCPIVVIGFEKQQIITHRGCVKGVDANAGNPLYNFQNWEITLG